MLMIGYFLTFKTPSRLMILPEMIFAIQSIEFRKALIPNGLFPKYNHSKVHYLLILRIG